MELASSSLQNAAAAATLEVLETMFFEVPLDGPSPVDSPDEGSICALARFSGTEDGSLAVGMPEETLKTFTESFLGADGQEISPAQSLAVICELANMLCGATLSRYAPHARIAIAPPQIISSSQVSGSRWLRFPLECGSLAVSLTWKGL